MMAAVAAPPTVAGAPTTVTTSGTVPGNNLAIVFPASDPFVVSYQSDTEGVKVGVESDTESAKVVQYKSSTKSVKV